MAIRGKQVTDIAYAAGVLDGEGTITLTHHKNDTFQVMVIISNTDYNLLYWFKDTFGGRVYEKRPDQGAGHWRLEKAQDQEEFLEMLLPYLKVKRVQARLALAFRALVGNGGPVSEETGKARWDLYYKIQSLNAFSSTKKRQHHRAAATTERENTPIKGDATV